MGATAPVAPVLTEGLTNQTFMFSKLSFYFHLDKDVVTTRILYFCWKRKFCKHEQCFIKHTVYFIEFSLNFV